MLKRIVWLVLFVGLAMGLVGSPVQAQSNDNRLVLSDIEYQSSFPTISFNMRAYVDGYLSEGLENTLSITEDGGMIGAPIIERLPDLPVHLTVFIDNDPYSFSGRSTSEVNQILGSLRDLGYRDGDTISLYSTNGKFADHTSWSSFNTWLQNGMSVPSGNDLNSQPALTTALRETAARKESGETVGFIYIVRVLQEGYSAANKNTVINGIAAEAGRLGLAIHIIHADSATSGYQDSLSVLAQQTGGGYIGLISGSTTPQFTTQFSPMVAPLFRSRANYRVQYQSTGNSTASRNVSVQAAGQTNSFTYAVALQPPIVTIHTPNNGQIIDRQVIQNVEAGRNEIGMNSADVRFSVSFPDNYPRPLQNVQILELSTNAQLPIYTLIPGASETVFQTTWDLAQIDTPGDNPRTLRVIVTDNLGLPGQAEVGVTMPIPAPPPVPVPDIINIVRHVCDVNSTSRECFMARVVEYTPYLIIAALFIMVLLLRRQILNSPIGKGISYVAETVTDVYGDVKSTIIGLFGGSDDTAEPPDFAYLTITSGQTAKINGEESADRRIPIKQLVTRIGRGKNGNHISFYSEADKGSLSRNHCSIDIDIMQKTVRVKNISDKNHIQVNQKTLNPGQLEILPNNATLVLGNPDNKGVSFIFTYGPTLMGGAKPTAQVIETDVDDPTKPDRHSVYGDEPIAPRPQPVVNTNHHSDDNEWMKGLRS